MSKAVYNKMQIQRDAKRRHLLARSEMKAYRRGEPVLDRAAPSKKKKPTILIVCEGINTEPSYFNQFKLSSATIKAIGKGQNTISLIKEARKLNNEATYEQTWCVFDKDEFTDNDFNNAVKMAEHSGFNLAYSNQAFEYWLILHFEDHQGGNMNREDYSNTINIYVNPLGANYDGNGSKIIDRYFFDILNGIDATTGKPRVHLAINRARRNFKRHSEHSPAHKESSTLVFKLIEEISKYI